MSYPYVDPYVTGTAYTDSSGGRSSGDWQAAVMTPVTSDTVTTNQNKTGIVDAEGRVASVYESRARTATPTAYPLRAREARGVAIFINVTAVTSTPSVVVTIDGYNATAGTWTTLLTSAAISTVSTKRMVIAPGIVVAANLTVDSVIPETIRVVMTHGNTDSITYTVDADWLP